MVKERKKCVCKEVMLLWSRINIMRCCLCLEKFLGVVGEILVLVIVVEWWLFVRKCGRCNEKLKCLWKKEKC